MKLVKSLEFDPVGFEDFAWWVENDHKKALKIIKLIKDIQRNPLEGIGQPEKLKHELFKAFQCYRRGRPACLPMI